MIDVLHRILDPANANVRTHLVEMSFFQGSSTIVVLLGPLSFWLQLIIMLIMQASVSAVLAIVVYHSIVVHRGSPFSYLVGFGFVIPAAIWIPFWFIRYFGVVNISVMIGACALTVVVPFHCVEAMYGTSPIGVESSLQRYLGYYCSTLPFKRHPATGQPIRMTYEKWMDKLPKFSFHVGLLVVSLAVMVHCDFVLFTSSRDRDAFLPSTIWGLLDWRHLLNNLSVATFTYQCLDVGSAGVGIIVSVISGCEVIDLMKNPLFGSQSPSDFWGRRWNLMLHDSFKRGIFTPLVMMHYSRAFAMLITFVVSGIVHEHVCTVIHMKYRLYPELAQPYEPYYGRHLLFFVWNGFVVLFEYLLSPLPVFQWLKANLSKRIISALVLITVLPVSHWFTDEYVRSGFYSDYSMGFPLILYLKTSD